MNGWSIDWMLQLSLSLLLSLLLLEGDGVGELLLFNLVVVVIAALILFVSSLSLLDK
jgi:hypothetical protein